MRKKKISILVLVSLMVLSLSACNLGDNRDMTRGYDTPDLMGRNDNNMGRTVTPYGYNNDFNGNDRFGRYGYYNRDTDRIADNYPYAPNYRYRTNQFQTNANRDADRMADLAARIKGVDDATVVIANGNAYVGLDLNDTIQKNQENKVERQVYNSLKKFSDRYNINISSDADLFGRLRDIGDGIRDGNQVDRYQTDFNDFGNRFRNFTR